MKIPTPTYKEDAWFHSKHASLRRTSGPMTTRDLRGRLVLPLLSGHLAIRAIGLAHWGETFRRITIIDISYY